MHTPDSEDSDFRGDKHKDFDEISLDKELDENKVLEELDLKVDTEQRMTLGHKNIDGDEGHVIVSKMENVFKQGGCVVGTEMRV